MNRTQEKRLAARNATRSIGPPLQSRRRRMKSHLKAAVIASTLVAAPILAVTATAQPVPGNPASSTVVPVVVGAAAGATVGALLWPVIMPATAVAAAPGAAAVVPEAATWGWGAFVTTRALVGAIIGGALGYVAAR